MHNQTVTKLILTLSNGYQCCKEKKSRRKRKTMEVQAETLDIQTTTVPTTPSGQCRSEGWADWEAAQGADEGAQKRPEEKIF
jgi:hypothetical protein